MNNETNVFENCIVFMTHMSGILLIEYITKNFLYNKTHTPTIQVYKIIARTAIVAWGN